MSLRLLRSGSLVDPTADRSGLTINPAGGQPLLLTSLRAAALRFPLIIKNERGGLLRGRRALR